MAELYRRRHRKRMISFLVPFHEDRDAPDRAHIWHWLRRYWHSELPDVEVVIGHDYNRHRRPFSKTRAVNNAARRAKGDIFVILDADCYMDSDVIRRCAHRIRESEQMGHPLWFIPYRHIYRLTRHTSKRLLRSDPRRPLHIPSPPPSGWVESTQGSMHGHRFGALVQIMSRYAFWLVGGMDERFCGWGGEDVSFVRALDTLYGSHKTTDNDVLHVWHHHIGVKYDERRWEGQESLQANGTLAQRYNRATGDRVRMQSLIEEPVEDHEIP